VAFKKINPNFYFQGAADVKTDNTNSKFLFIKIKKKLLDILVSLKIFPGQVLAAIVFKQVPADDEIEELKTNGYHLVYIPKKSLFVVKTLNYNLSH